MNIEELKKEFFHNLNIKEEDKIRAEKALFSKGYVQHILLKNKLLSWSNKECIDYTIVASAYRYDKRIRNVLFKYISYLEEFYRGIIIDEYSKNPNQNFWIPKLNDALENNMAFNEALDQLLFSLLLDQCQKLPEEIQKKLLFSEVNNYKKNMNALKTLRNTVMHNKFLLLYRGFQVCYVSGVDNNKSGSLKANILNLIQFLPPEVGKKCALAINNCKEDRNEETDTKWELPPEIVITIDI